MSELVLMCSLCYGEILNVDEIRNTPGGRMVCVDCAVNCYVDIPLE